MNYYNASGQMDLSDRIAIETGICIGESFKKIAKRLRRHPSTIAHEVKENRTFIKGNYPNGKDCRMARQCTVRNLCGCDEEACNTKCRLCRGVDCTKVCDRYVSVACHKFDSPPYVCNNCINGFHSMEYAVPKGKSLNPYTQEDMTLLMNHINSVKRPGLGNKSPYELVEEDDEDFKALMSLLKMHLIPPDEVHLMPDLFVKK